MVLNAKENIKYEKGTGDCGVTTCDFKQCDQGSPHREQNSERGKEGAMWLSVSVPCRGHHKHRGPEVGADGIPELE